MEEFVKLLGFDSLNQYNKLVFTADVSTPEKLAAFEKWQEEDGTKEGLLRLRGETEDKLVTLRGRQFSPDTKIAEVVTESIAQKEIILIDDKPYGLQQIKNAIPGHKKDDYKLLHFSTFSDYQNHIQHKVWMVLVDFSLDLDQRYGSHLAPQIKADIIIGFSSKRWASEVIIEAIKQQRRGDELPQLFAIEKLKEIDHNEELAKLFSRIL